MIDLKICVYTICKNEEFFAKRWLRSAEEADAIFVNDTGSTDKTVEILQAHPKVTLIKGKATGDKFRFDHAWNEVLDIIPDDFDFCVRLDMDMMLTCGWYEGLKKFLSDMIEKKTFIPSIHNISLNLFQIERKIGESWWIKGSRWTGLIHSYSKNARFFGPVHERLVFYELKEHLGEDVPSEIMCAVHTERINNLDAKNRFYSMLSEKRFKECPTYMNFLIAMSCCVTENIINYVNLVDTVLAEISPAVNTTLSKVEQGLKEEEENFARRIEILYLRLYIKKFLAKNEDEVKKTIEEIKSLKSTAIKMYQRSCLDNCINRILFLSDSDKKDYYEENFFKREGPDLYNYIIKEFDK